MSRKNNRATPRHPAGSNRAPNVPGNVTPVLQQAISLHQLGRLPEAESLYRAVLSAFPSSVDALHLLGVIRLQGGDADAAVNLIRRAIRLRPDHAAAHSHLADAYLHLGQPRDALLSCDRAIALQPEFAEALNNRGNALRALGRPDDALASYDRALGANPRFVEAHYNRGTVLAALGRHEAALASYDQALQVNPAYVPALIGRGGVLHGVKRFDEAVACFERALVIEPGHARAWNNLGTLLFELRRFDAAAHAFEKVVQLLPGSEYADGNLLRARQHCCDWTDFDIAVARMESKVASGARVIAPFAFIAMSDSPVAQLQCARTYVADRFPAAGRPLWRGERYRHERIRLAYLSPDFREHALAYLVAELFERHDKSRFEMIAVSLGPDDGSAMRDRLRRSFEHFVDARGTDDLAVARMLRDREIDIAVDLAGFTQDSRTGILAHRPAPVQVNYLGYPGSVGADYVDYIIADAQIIPGGDEAYYTEKVVRLPDVYQANDSTRAAAKPGPGRASVGLPATGFVFCCFNSSYKITPAMFEIWMRLLRRVEGSVLWLFDDNPAATRNLRLAAEQHAVPPDRLVFAGRLRYPDHLARHELADLFLDTFPYNAHTTASDALLMGLPLLTCSGASFPSRVAGSLLGAIGVPELIARNPAEYEFLALELALQPTRISELKRCIRENRTKFPLFDAGRFRRNLEAVYVQMHERCRTGLPPASFSAS